MKTSTFTGLAGLAGTASAQVSAWGQCGGMYYTGSTSCQSGWSCNYMNDWYSQCLPASSSGTTASTSATTHKASSAAAPSTFITRVSSSRTAPTPASSVAASTTSSAPSVTSTASTSGKVKYAGVNIAGFDFGCSTDGTCVTSSVYDIVSDGNALAQMNHFISDTGLNAFRLPVGWQYLVADTVGGDLDATNFGQYDKLVQGCLDSGAGLCIIDVHNYARWNGAIIGQGGPTDDQFAALWSSLATKYASESKIAFGVMNEPHDLSSIETWATTVQAAVKAIRNAGATSQYILLPGTDYASASEFIDNGSGAALLKVTNPDGTTDNLIFDVHKYLDSNGSGTSTECVTNNIDTAFSPLADWLRTNGRMAFNSESGGGNTDSCLQYLCEQYKFIHENSDVYLGYTSWAAGGFDSTYELVETPTQSGSTWTDMEIVSQCVAGTFTS